MAHKYLHHTPASSEVIAVAEIEALAPDVTTRRIELPLRLGLAFPTTSLLIDSKEESCFNSASKK
jgi:hypothetical protein